MKSMKRLITSFTILTALLCAPGAVAKDNSRLTAALLAKKIQKADYEGDRAALLQLHEELAPFLQKNEIASRVNYWRGFALWRRALNGANENATAAELDADLVKAVEEFRESATDAEFVDAKVALASCLFFRVFLHRGDSELVQALVPEAMLNLKQAEASAPGNPRLLWVLGAEYWYLPPERGGGHARALDTYQRGLEMAKKQTLPLNPLDPVWGEPELLMNLAWSNLNNEAPDLDAAEHYAKAALALVPNWHYVRDILLAQIRAVRKKT